MRISDWSSDVCSSDLDKATTVRLTRCPLLETAKEFPDVVCGVHLGIVRGALEEYGGDSERTDLFAFSEPGACRSAERSVGKECVSTCRSRLSAYHSHKNNTQDTPSNPHNQTTS